MSVCNFCKNKLSNEYLLKRHQKTNKKCISIQSKILNNEDDEKSIIVSCEFCLKNFSKYDLKRHLNTCKIKKEK